MNSGSNNSIVTGYFRNNLIQSFICHLKFTPLCVVHIGLSETATTYLAGCVCKTCKAMHTFALLSLVLKDNFLLDKNLNLLRK